MFEKFVTPMGDSDISIQYENQLTIKYLVYARSNLIILKVSDKKKKKYSNSEVKKLTITLLQLMY